MYFFPSVYEVVLRGKLGPTTLCEVKIFLFWLEAIPHNYVGHLCRDNCKKFCW